MSRKLVYESYEDNSGRVRNPPAEVIRRLEDRLGSRTLPAGETKGPGAFVLPKPTSGLAIQLYGLRHEDDWGIGDFTGLARLCRWAAEQGLGFIGVNPLHALKTAVPAATSPYYPVSRYAIHPLYINVPDLANELGTDLKLNDTATSALHRAQIAELIDYDAVSTAKISALREIFRQAEDAAAIRSFAESCTPEIRAHAIWEAYSHQTGTLPDQSVLTFTAPIPEELRAEVAFHLFLQWAADLQLRRAAEAGGDRTGLYLDLAVGAAPDGSEVLGSPDRYVQDVSLGAPPDLMGPQGQDWGIAPLHPVRLAEERGEGFGRILDASACYAKALRIDHALGLERQFFIPHGTAAEDATYVAFPRHHMFDAICRVSRSQSCTMIGEALGTVPPGLVKAMHERSVFSYEVTRWARDENDAFLEAADYPALSLATVTTHDIAPISGWAIGADIEERRRIGHIARSDLQNEKENRQKEVDGLSQLWNIEVGSDDHDTVCAAHRFLARTNARIAMMTLEDLLVQKEMVNLPGTTDQHSNWQRRYATCFEEWSGNSEVLERLEAGLR